MVSRLLIRNENPDIISSNTAIFIGLRFFCSIICNEIYSHRISGTYKRYFQIANILLHILRTASPEYECWGHLELPDLMGKWEYHYYVVLHSYPTREL